MSGSSWRSHPELTQYVSTVRYDDPKEDFRTIARKLGGLLDPQRPCRVADVGCGNGELLYHLRRCFPDWEYAGFDHTPEFIDTARSFPGLAGVRFEVRDLDDVEGRFDVVIATCFISLFEDAAAPLGKLLELCRAGGWVLATGLFNPHDIEVRVQFCDNSRPETAGVWRSDFNRHSQRALRECFAARTRRIEFEECRYDLDLPPDPAHPIRVWSLRDAEGRSLLVNGAWQIANQTLLVMQKK